MNPEMLELLFKLQEMPMAPAKRLAEEIGKSTPTVISWLARLTDERVFLGVKPDLEVHRLGLEIYDYLLEVPSYEALTKIEHFCESHPYTLYRARVYGGQYRGILVQFRQPPETNKYLEEAFAIMTDNGLIRSIREIPTLQEIYGSIHTRPRLDAWDSERMTWKFDWDKWWDIEPRNKETATSNKNTQPQDRIKIDKLDAKILQELTKNARQKNIDIIKNIGIDPKEGSVQQKISKRILRLRDVIASYRVFINWTYFDVYNTPMLIVKANPESTERLMAKLAEGTFPFSSSFRKKPDGFVWYARLPSAHFSELITLVWKISQGYELLIIDYKHSQTYGLWAETLNEESEEWISNKTFCLESPLKAIGLQ